MREFHSRNNENKTRRPPFSPPSRLRRRPAAHHHPPPRSFCRLFSPARVRVSEWHQRRDQIPSARDAPSKCAARADLFNQYYNYNSTTTPNAFINAPHHPSSLSIHPSSVWLSVQNIYQKYNPPFFVRRLLRQLSACTQIHTRETQAQHQHMHTQHDDDDDTRPRKARVHEKCVVA